MSRETILDVINDAFLSLDGDISPIVDNSTAYKTGLRLANRVAAKILRRRDWSFLREVEEGRPNSFIELPEAYRVSRVVDSLGHTWVEKRTAKPLFEEYYVDRKEVCFGFSYHHHHYIPIALYVYFQPVTMEYTLSTDLVEPRFYDLLVVGTTAELCKIDEAYRNLAADRESDFQDMLEDLAYTDIINANEGIRL